MHANHTSRDDGYPVIRVKKLRDNAVLPTRAHASDAGADLVACEDVTLKPGERTLVPCGIAIALPHGYVGLIHPRSGLALRVGLGIVNSPGTIDADYRGEIKVLLINFDPARSMTVRAGDRIAQLVIQKVELSSFEQVDELDDTQRGGGGYGSTGV